MARRVGVVDACMDKSVGWLSVALRPQKPSGLLGTGAQDGHLDFHTAPELWISREDIDNSILVS